MSTSSRTALPENLCAEIRATVASEAFLKLVQTLRYGGKTFRVSVRPVRIRDENRYQFETVDGGKVSIKNLSAKAAADGLEEILSQPGARELHLLGTGGDLHIRVTKKGKVLLSRGASSGGGARDLSHDHAKHQPLGEFDSSALLKVLGISDADGRIKPSMRAKYDQINQFLRELGALLPETAPEAFSIVDCGCGKAYLTLSAYLWLVQVRGYRLRVCGIDSNESIIAEVRQMAERLELGDEVEFLACRIADAVLPFAPDAVFALHACDTATDDALALACRQKARYILSAPCCQHTIQKQMQAPAVFRPLIRQGLLKERLADLLADCFRAQILRIFGYRVNLVEFVALDVTPRNLLIRAQSAVKPGQIEAMREYVELRDCWRVKPPLEERLQEELKGLGLQE